MIAVLASLNKLGIPDMVTGSMTSNLHGIPRSTKGADLVLQVSDHQAGELARDLASPLRLDPRMSFETVTGTSRFIVELRGSPLKIELFLLSEDPHDQERFRRRRSQTMLGMPIWVSTPEDCIITKLRWSKEGRRTKDIEDVRNVLAVQGDALDEPYLHRWCDAHGTRELLECTRASIPPRPASRP